MIEEIDTMIKENVKSKKILKQNIQEILYIMEGYIKNNMNRRFLGQGLKKMFLMKLQNKFSLSKEKETYKCTRRLRTTLKVQNIERLLYQEATCFFLSAQS